MNKAKIIVVIIVVFLVLLAPLTMFTSIAPKTKVAATKAITVNSNGGASYTKIQDAINAASPGDTIYVYNGVYNEQITINKSIGLAGQSNQSTIIKGSGNNVGVYIKANYTRVSNVRVDNCYIAVGLDGCSNNSIASNTITNSLCGIYVSGGSGNNVISNTITNSGYGIYIYSSNNNITSNTITGCGASISLFGSGNTVVVNKITNSSSFGIYSDPWSSNNNIVANTMINSEAYVFGDCNVTNNTINGKPLLYYKNIDATTSPQVLDNVNANGIILYRCSGFAIKNTKIEGGSIVLSQSSHIAIASNTVTHTNRGIYLYYCLNNDVVSNTVTNCNIVDIVLDCSNNTNITSNTVTNSYCGIYLYSSYINIIKSNNIYDNKGYGLYSDSSSYNTAIYNWWGALTGPHCGRNLVGRGDNVSGNIVPIRPWARSPFSLAQPPLPSPSETDIGISGASNWTDLFQSDGCSEIHGFLVLPLNSMSLTNFPKV